MLLSISLYACIITSRPLDSRPGDPVACFSEHGGILPEPCSKCTTLWPCSSHFQKRDGAVTHWKSHVGFSCGGHFVYRRGSARTAASPWLVDRPTLTPCSELILPLVPDLPGSAGPWPVSDSQGLDAVRGLLMCSADCSPGCCPSPPSCRPSVGSQKWGTRVRVRLRVCVCMCTHAAYLSVPMLLVEPPQGPPPPWRTHSHPQAMWCRSASNCSCLSLRHVTHEDPRPPTNCLAEETHVCLSGSHLHK